ncbi:MAG: YggS family pyridoxal phosphate-dependent enzyme [Burkholderiales bacterium]|nr:YggS family pyridoxal phosphate-dependent enzyme [Burkholderiales bacterium]
MSEPAAATHAAIADGLARTRARIAAAEHLAGRAAGSVRLVAVSKTFGPDAVRAAFAAGQTDFGENYVQEAVAKQDATADLRDRLVWHFIGPIQSNKTRDLAERFDWVHAIDRLKIAQRLSDQRPPLRPPLDVCVQVNVSGEATKGGVAPADAVALAAQCAALPGLTLRGFMAIPAPVDTLDAQRAQCRVLREVFDAARAAGLAVDTLSIGMSDDLEAAVLEGTTVVRVGRAIFGARG